MPKQFCFVMNFLQVCVEMIWDFWLLGNESFGRIWLYCL